MTATKRLLRQALTLSPVDRAEIAAELIASLDGDGDADAERAWAAEVERRLERAEASETKSRPWSAVRDRLLGEPSE